MNPLNIFVVHPSDSLTDHLPNGAGWIDYNYLRGLAERGHTLHVATPRVELRGPVPPRMYLHLIPGTDVHRPGPLTRLRYVLGVRKLFRKLNKQVRFDLAQQLTPVETGLSLALLGSGMPLVLGPYSGHWAAEAFGPPKPRSLAARLKHQLRDLLASVQQSSGGRARHHLSRGYRAYSLTGGARSNACTSSATAFTAASICRAIRCRRSPPFCFLPYSSTGRASSRCWTRSIGVAPRVPDVTLEIWGDGRESAAVDARIAKSPHRERIFRRGRAAREDVAAIMRAHSVYCMPSYGEPFGMTLLEAMASAVPVVTTDVGGPPYLVHRDGGRVVPMRDAEQLADALTEILAEPRAAGEHGQLQPQARRAGVRLEPLARSHGERLRAGAASAAAGVLGRAARYPLDLDRRNAHGYVHQHRFPRQSPRVPQVGQVRTDPAVRRIARTD